jgi:ribosomal protein L20A (L18A)
MSRGIFNFLQSEPSYTESYKDWHIELSQSTYFWYDLLVHPVEGFDTKRQVIDYLKQLEAMVESQIDKRFIYFLAARTKLRFSVTKKPRYSLFGNDLIFYIEIGRKKIRKKFTTKVFDAQTGRPIKPSIEISERLITFQYAPNQKISVSVYDFLQNCEIEVGINTEIHYVGYTRKPSERPINGSHRGLTDMLYKVSNEEYDFFVFYNLFKVLSIARNENHLISYCVANSMIDEVKVDEEGRIIEKALIKYFCTELQKVNKQNEEAELENSLERLASKNRIKSVAIHIEMSEPSELYRFFSQSVAPSDKHLFTCRIGNDGVEIVQGSKIVDAVI